MYNTSVGTNLLEQDLELLFTLGRVFVVSCRSIELIQAFTVRWGQHPALHPLDECF